MSDSPEPLAIFLGPVVDALAPYRFDKMVITGDQTVEHNCNWKIIIENFSEHYHVDHIHPQHQSFVDCCNDTLEWFRNGHTGLAVRGATVNPRYPIPDEPTDLLTEQLKSPGLGPSDCRGRAPEIRKAAQMRKRKVGAAMAFDYSAFNDDQLSDVPMALVLLYFLAVGGAPHIWSHVLGTILVIARVAHAWGLSTNPGTTYARLFGAQITFLLLSILSFAGLYFFLTQ